MAWYPFEGEDFAGYFKLVHGDLIGCPMGRHGERIDDPEFIDFFEMMDTDMEMSALISELEKRP